MTIQADERRTSDRVDVSQAQIGHRFGHFRHGAVRMSAFVLALGVFFYAANAIDPGQSAAIIEGPEALADEGPTSIGRLGGLTSLEYTVEIHATIEGPRYTVRDSKGQVLGSMLEAMEVEQIAPGLEIEGMYSEPVMLAEPRGEFPN